MHLIFSRKMMLMLAFSCREDSIEYMFSHFVVGQGSSGSGYKAQSGAQCALNTHGEALI